MIVVDLDIVCTFVNKFLCIQIELMLVFLFLLEV